MRASARAFPSERATPAHREPAHGTRGRATVRAMLGGGRSRWGIASVLATLALGVSGGSAQAVTWTVSNPQPVTEGNSGTKQVTFTVTGSGFSLGGDSVSYATVDGTATAPGDYTSTTGTVTVSALEALAGTVQKQVSVNVKGDTTPEGDETFKLVLDDGNGTSGTATILNDDAPHLRVSDPSVNEHDGTAVFTLSLDGAAAVTVHYATADGSAVAGQDYQPRSGDLSFARGETSKQVAVPIVDDTIHEDTESFALSLSGASGIAAGGNKLTGTATIADDDPVPASPPPPPPPATGTTGTPGTGGAPSTSGSSLNDTTNPQPHLTAPRAGRGTIVVAIACPATELLCRGTLTTFAEPDRHQRSRWLHREHRLGSATFVIAGGKRALITTRISRSALRQLRRARRISIRSYAVVRDAAGNIGTASVGARLARVR